MYIFLTNYIPFMHSDKPESSVQHHWHEQLSKFLKTPFRQCRHKCFTGQCKLNNKDDEDKKPTKNVCNDFDCCCNNKYHTYTNGQTMYNIEKMINRLFQIHYNLMATHLRENPIKSCSRYDFNPYDSSNSDYIYGSSNCMIIFPNDGIRINATKSYV